MNEVMIREAEVSEREFLADLTKSVYSEYAEEMDPVFWTNYQKSIAETVIAGEGLIRLVAQIGDKIAGSVILCRPYERTIGTAVLKNPHWEMRLLAVPAEFRNYGLGGRLISYCENKVVELGEPVLTLHTTVLMKTAAAMYRRRGYVRYPAIDFEPAPGFTVHGYIKHLQTSAVPSIGSKVSHTTTEV